MTPLPGRDPIQWIERLEDWTGSLPVVLVLDRFSPRGRRAALKDLAATVLGVDPGLIEISHHGSRAPVLGLPSNAGLVLSSASRGGAAALAIARSALGVDVEQADGGEIPWLALHPGERAFLNQLEGPDQALAFARLWSLKEAYVKAQGLGFKRAPEGFEVRLEDDGTAAIDDPAPAQPVALVSTRWRETPDGLAAISVVALEAGGLEPGPCAPEKPPSIA